MTGTSPAPPRRDEALAYIRDRIGRAGVCPSYEEIARAMEPRIGKTRAKQLVDQLIERGVISRDPGSRRGIQVHDLAPRRHVVDRPPPPAPCTFEQLPLLPLIVEDPAVY